MYVSEMSYLDSLRGRTVALVGSAASIEGTGHGSEIEGADVVVRVNFGAPVPERLHVDAGTRTDVLYHIGTNGERELRADELPAAGLLVHTRGRSTPRVMRFAATAARRPWTSAGAARSALRGTLACPPNTGAVAFAHLLYSPVAALSVYGFDFYASGHWEGQGAETVAQARAQAGGRGMHDQAAHRRWFRGAARDPRVRLAPRVREALDA